MHIVHFFNVFRVFHFVCISKWNVATYTLGKKGKIHYMCKCNKKLQRKFYFMLPIPQWHVVIFTYYTHFNSHNTDGGRKFYICRKTEKFSVCCCWCYSIQSHHHQMHFIFIICTQSLHLYTQCIWNALCRWNVNKYVLLVLLLNHSIGS